MSAHSPADSFFTISGFYPESLLEALPAKTSAQPIPKAKALKGKDRASTSRQSASSEKSALVGSLLRTALISELAAQTSSSLHWKSSATPVGRLWSVLATSEPITSGLDHGSSDATLSKLPTPMAIDGSRGPDFRDRTNGTNLRTLLSTPRASDMKAGGHGDTGRMGSVRHQLQQAMLATPRKTDGERGGRGDVLSQLRGYPSKHAGMPLERLPTPTKRDKRDKRMDAWSPAYDKRKSPTMDAVMSGAMMSLTPTAKGNLTSPSMLKWAGARALASLLQSHGLTGTAALPITYGWMMGYPPGWLSRALQSAVRAGLLQHPSSSKRSATP